MGLWKRLPMAHVAETGEGNYARLLRAVNRIHDAKKMEQRAKAITFKQALGTKED
jgi:hypothetical protein